MNTPKNFILNPKSYDEPNSTVQTSNSSLKDDIISFPKSRNISMKIPKFNNNQMKTIVIEIPNHKEEIQNKLKKKSKKAKRTIDIFNSPIQKRFKSGFVKILSQRNLIKRKSLQDEKIRSNPKLRSGNRIIKVQEVLNGLDKMELEIKSHFMKINEFSGSLEFQSWSNDLSFEKKNICDEKTKLNEIQINSQNYDPRVKEIKNKAQIENIAFKNNANDLLLNEQKMKSHLDNADYYFKKIKKNY